VNQNNSPKHWGVPQNTDAPAAKIGTLSLPPQPKMGSGFPTLLRKELMRFWKVGFQTIAAPVLTALMYLLIFAHVLEGRVTVYDSVPYTAFLIPGLMMMSMLQNAFCEPVLITDSKPHHWQSGLYPAATAVAPRDFRRLSAGVHRPRCLCGPLCVAGVAVLRFPACGQAFMGIGVCRHVLRHHGHLGSDRRTVV